MEDDILNTIEVLSARVAAKEEEANKLKKLVNELCGEAKIPLRFPVIAESGGVSALRADLFYGMPLTAAIRSYLELRKASHLGAATVVEIYRAIRDGGYKFDTKNEDNARISVGNALRKTSSVFHRLPNGQYGLLSWYPSARAPHNGDLPEVKHRGAKAKKAKSRSKDANAVTNADIRDMILSQSGEFQKADIEKQLKLAQPGKSIPSAKTAAVLYLLKSKGLIRVTSARAGRTGATFTKA